MTPLETRIVPVILAGGKGTRLWPLSRGSRPKQFLPLVDKFSLFQQTLKRVSDPKIYARPIIVTSEDYRFMVVEQAEDCGVELDKIILEPVARNTTAAILAAAAIVSKEANAQLLHILPSDHLLESTKTYMAAVDVAAKAAKTGQLVTFGIRPSEPETGYGYLQANDNNAGSVKVQKFVEKPDLQSATEMINQGGYFWNSGMFMLNADVFMSECQALAPVIFDAVTKAALRAEPDMNFVRLESKSFEASPSISVDFAIFEKSDLVYMVKLDEAWSDLGAWDAIWKAQNSIDPEGNYVHGPTHLSQTKNSLVYSERDLVVVSGLDDVAVIASEDVVYVGKLSDAQSVGEIVKTLRADPLTLPLTETHRTSYRPWGGYSTIEQGERYQVKRLFVKPGKKLSLQKHHHRSEHWIVVRGTAEVTIDDVVQTVSENESVYLHRGAVHRLANPGKILLELIEVQTGSYLGEDDIIRIEDEFGRV